MVIIPRSEKFHQNEDRFPCRGDHQLPCIVCGKATDIRGPMLLVADCQTVNGEHGMAACTEEEFEQTEPGVRLYGYPVGPNCLKKHPELKPYVAVPDSNLGIPGGDFER